MRRLRILKVAQTYYPFLAGGGRTVKVDGLARELAGRGHAIRVITADLGGCGDAQDPESRWTREPFGWRLERHGVESLHLSSLLRYRTTTLNPSLLRIAPSFREFDVAHIYGLYDLLGPMVSAYCRRWDIPYVLEPLGMFVPRVRSLRIKRAYHRLFTRGMLDGAAKVLATSETERAELEESGVPAGRLLVRRNGLDLNLYERLPVRGPFRDELDIPRVEPLTLFLGRISRIKGLDLLLRGFRQALVPGHLVIAGPDDGDGCLQELVALAKRLNLREAVHFPGPLYQERKLQALSDADVVVLPSSYESYGNAAAEGIAAGLPVLATDRCGIANWLRGKGGVVVPFEIESLGQALRSLCADAALRERLRAATMRWRHELGWSVPAERMEALYNALGARGSRPESMEQICAA